VIFIRIQVVFFSVSFIILIAGIIGIIVSNDIVSKTDIILYEKMPIKNASMEAVIAIISACGLQ
jgi:hypothetical protein